MKLLLLFTTLALGAALRVVDRPEATMQKEFQTDSGKVTLIVADKRRRALNIDGVSDPNVPSPFKVRSNVLGVQTPEQGSSRQGRKLTLDRNGIPIIDGVREPDDPQDTQVYRNARVINNVFVKDEDNVLNQVEDSDESSSRLARQGRILTGSAVAPEAIEKIDNLPDYVKAYPYYYLLQNYQPNRAGLIDPSSDNDQNEKIVTYSYSTADGGGIQQSKSKDVVYGAGFAEHPPKDSSLANAKVSYKSVSSSPQSFNPSQPWAGFQPLESIIGSSSDQQLQKMLLSPPASSSQVKFPGSSSSSFSLEPPSDSIPQTTRFQQLPPPPSRHRLAVYQQPQQQIANLAAPSTFRVPFQPHRSVPQRRFSLTDPGLQRNRFQSGAVPTPHQAFGEAAHALIHPEIFPANPDNFVVEKSTFQAHPGAPTFSVPIPRPASQVPNRNDFEYAVQQYQQPDEQYYQYDPPYYYQTYLEEVDNRPFIEKMMDPIRRVGEKVKQFASPVLDPMIGAGQRFGYRFRIPERIDKLASGTVDADAIPLFAGAAAVATLGALGAYAASKYSLADLKKLLPPSGKRSSQASIPDILLQLADDLENEDPSFMSKFTSSPRWLENSCAQKIFCTLVTSTMKDEEKKLEDKIESEASTAGDDIMRSREGRDLLETDIMYIEKQMGLLLEKSGGTTAQKIQRRHAANNVLAALRQRNCSRFSCDNKT